MKQKNQRDTKILQKFLTGAAGVGLLGLTIVLLVVMMIHSGPPRERRKKESNLGAVELFFENCSRAISGAIPGFEISEENTVKKYRIDADDVAPKPDKNCYGKAADPGQLADVIAEARALLNGQSLLLSTDTDIMENFGIIYYLDETILTLTWKQLINNVVYTFSEVKIADPSQFRRYLAGGTYGSGKLVYPTEMANTVNSVVASSGDYFEFRNAGVIVYNGDVCRVNGGADTCFVDSNGDLSFVRAKDRMTKESAADYVEDNDIQFSLAFGPILVENGELNRFGGYGLGEIDGMFSRAALCQMDELHYLLINACAEGNHHRNLTMYEFAKQVHETGCRMAYALDGGQTAAHMVGGVLVNEVTRGYQRKISDIIYFGSAVPNQEKRY